jgi:hypothetical protein
MARWWSMLFYCSLLFSTGLWAQTYPAGSVYKRPPASLPPAGGDAVCPWLTEGSAVKALGGNVRVVLSLTNASQGSCTFVSTAHPHDQLRVIVGAVGVPSCPSGSEQVVGVGSGASRCRLPIPEQAQMVSGRVRAVHMAITLSGAGNAMAAMSLNRNDDTIQQIAEQVAGNLF